MFFYCIFKYHVKFWIYMPIQHIYCTMKFFYDWWHWLIIYYLVYHDFSIMLMPFDCSYTKCVMLNCFFIEIFLTWFMSIPCLNLCYSLIAGVEMIPCGYSSADSYYTLQGRDQSVGWATPTSGYAQRKILEYLTAGKSLL